MKRANKQKASQLRRKICTLISRMEVLLQEVLRREDMVKGTVYQRRRRRRSKEPCGKGTADVGEAFSYSDEGKTIHVALGGLNRKRLRECVENYRRFRVARAELCSTWRELLATVDEMESVRRIRLEDLRRGSSPAKRLRRV